MIISAPSADAPMFVMGVNHEKYSSDMKGNKLRFYLYHDYHFSFHFESVHCVQRGHQVRCEKSHQETRSFKTTVKMV